MAGLNKEIWLPEILEGFYADDMFLTEARDMSAFAENDKINLAEAGVNPDVLVNNTNYPLGIQERADVPIALELDYYDTENTVIRNAEKAELSYDKRQSVLFGHRQALKMTMMQKAIHAYAPDSDDTYTPVIVTTGADDGNGNKKLTFQDILNLAAKFDEAEIPSEGRILVLNANHKSHLLAEDLKQYKDAFEGDKAMFGGFKLYTLAEKRMPVYDKVTGVKAAYGAAPTANDTNCSVAFQKDEVMRATGTSDLFFREMDPEARGDIFGIQQRFLALPIRGKGIGAIYSPAV